MPSRPEAKQQNKTSDHFPLVQVLPLHNNQRTMDWFRISILCVLENFIQGKQALPSPPLPETRTLPPKSTGILPSDILWDHGWLHGQVSSAPWREAESTRLSIWSSTTMGWPRDHGRSHRLPSRWRADGPTVVLLVAEVGGWREYLIKKAGREPHRTEEVS